MEASFAAAGVHHVYNIGSAQVDQTITLGKDGEVWLKASRAQWQTLWAETSYRMQALRDNADCALQEHQRIGQDDPGLSAKLVYNPADDIAAPYINSGVRPKVAILREQGVNSQLEMAAAFERAGFTAVDVHMSDILSGRVNLQGFKGLAGCGGFSYGMCSAPVKVGPSRFCLTAAPAKSLKPSSTAMTPSPWGVQRLPDDVELKIANSRRRPLAAFCAQPFRAI